MLAHGMEHALKLSIIQRQQRCHIEVHQFAQRTGLTATGVLAPLTALRKPGKLGHVIAGQTEIFFKTR